MGPVANRPMGQGHSLCPVGEVGRQILLLLLVTPVLLVAVSLSMTGGHAPALLGSTKGMEVTQPLTTTLLELEVEATQDTYLDAWEPAQNRGHVRVLKLREGVHSILLGFDLTLLPPGAEVLTATLSLYAYHADKGYAIGAEVYQVLRPWQEAEASWLSPQAGETWDGAGCTGAGTDRAAAPGATGTLHGAERWYDFDVTNVARLWATGAAPNYGLLLAGTPLPPFDTYHFRSREEPARRPKLVITYRPGGTTPTATPTSPGPTHTQTVQPTSTTTSTPSHTPTAVSTSVPIRTPIPDSLYPYPEQRVGLAAFGISGVDIARLHAGLVKLEDRGPNTGERTLGVDFITVLRVGPGWCVPSDPSSWEECRAEIAQMVAANPGHLWFIGNEPENPCRPGWMPSGEYARTYHAVYQFIKEQDPTAQVGIGGAVLPSKIRRDWLEKVMEAYQTTYKEPMPVDVWNIHNLLLSECPGPCQPSDPNPCPPELRCSGGYVPPEMWCQKGWYFSQLDQARADLFKQLILEFRRWMKDRGLQNKPLIVTEMGVLAPRTDSGGPFPHERINQFMYETFEYMMTETDPEIGYPPDGYRLVQRWVWYALTPTDGFNGYLFDGQGEITDFGLNLANYTARFLPVSPVTIFFQRGWTGYTEDCDTTLRPVTSSPGSNSLWISADGTQKALLQFDLSVLPTNVEVVSATLSLFSSFHSSVDDMTVNCYGIKRPWDVSNATWVNATQTTQWEVPGCGGPSDREPTAASSAVVTSGETWYHFDVTDLAQSWVADPSANHGVVLEGEAAGAGYWTFVSSNQVEEPPRAKHRLRPKLELVVRLPEPVPTPTATLTPTPTATEAVTPTTTATPTVPSHTIHIPIILKGA
jgi:hypothetical protein